MTYLLTFSVTVFLSGDLSRLCLFWAETIFGWPIFKIMCETSTLHFPSKVAAITIERKQNNQLTLNTKFRSQIGNQMSNYRLLEPLLLTFIISSGLSKVLGHNYGNYFELWYIYMSRCRFYLWTLHGVKNGLICRSKGRYDILYYSFPVVDWLCLFIYLWVLTFPL